MEALIVFIPKHIGRGFASTVGEPSREMTIGDDHIDQRAEWGEEKVLCLWCERIDFVIEHKPVKDDTKI